MERQLSQELAWECRCDPGYGGGERERESCFLRAQEQEMPKWRNLSKQGRDLTGLRWKREGFGHWE